MRGRRSRSQRASPIVPCLRDRARIRLVVVVDGTAGEKTERGPGRGGRCRSEIALALLALHRGGFVGVDGCLIPGFGGAVFSRDWGRHYGPIVVGPVQSSAKHDLRYGQGELGPPSRESEEDRQKTVDGDHDGIFQMTYDVAQSAGCWGLWLLNHDLGTLPQSVSLRWIDRHTEKGSVDKRAGDWKNGHRSRARQRGRPEPRCLAAAYLGRRARRRSPGLLASPRPTGRVRDLEPCFAVGLRKLRTHCRERSVLAEHIPRRSWANGCQEPRSGQAASPLPGAFPADA